MPRYKPGQPGNPAGNPAGKPKGAAHEYTKLGTLIDPHSEELVAKAVEMALSGDSVAMRLCLERLIPPYKGISQSVVFEALKNATGLTEQAQSVINAIADSELSTGDGGWDHGMNRPTILTISA